MVVWLYPSMATPTVGVLVLAPGGLVPDEARLRMAEPEHLWPFATLGLCKKESARRGRWACCH